MVHLHLLFDTMRTHCIASNIQSKQYEWFVYDKGRLWKYNETPVSFTAAELAGWYRERYSDEVNVPVFN